MRISSVIGVAKQSFCGMYGINFMLNGFSTCALRKDGSRTKRLLRKMGKSHGNPCKIWLSMFSFMKNSVNSSADCVNKAILGGSCVHAWSFFRVLLLGLLIGLAACQPSWRPSIDPAEILPSRVDGTSDPTVIDQINDFRRRNVQVITMGENYLISVPASLLFADESPRLTWGSYDTLNRVVAFLQQFRKVAVQVTAYGSHYQSAKRDEVLSRTRAQVVANYLWSQGIDSRLMFANGGGARHPIASCGKHGDLSPNARIEITFRDSVI